MPEGEPEPDVALVRGDRRDYLQAHPGPLDAGLVVEVADTFLARDRGVKQRLYAQAGIPGYWIMNLITPQIAIYTDPVSTGRQAGYSQHRSYGPPAMVPVVLDVSEFGLLLVQDLLPWQQIKPHSLRHRS